MNSIRSYSLLILIFTLSLEVQALPKCQLNLFKQYSINENDYPDLFSKINAPFVNLSDGSINFTYYDLVDRENIVYGYNYIKFQYNKSTNEWGFSKEQNFFASNSLPTPNAADPFEIDYDSSSNIACTTADGSLAMDPGVPQFYMLSQNNKFFTFPVDETTARFCPARISHGDYRQSVTESGTIVSWDNSNNSKTVIVRTVAGNLYLIAPKMGDIGIGTVEVSDRGETIVYSGYKYNKYKNQIPSGLYIITDRDPSPKRYSSFLNLPKGYKLNAMSFIDSSNKVAGNLVAPQSKNFHPFVADGHTVKIFRLPSNVPRGYTFIDTYFKSRLADGRWVVHVQPYKGSLNNPGPANFYLYDETKDQYCDLKSFLLSGTRKKLAPNYIFKPASNGNLLLKFRSTYEFYSSNPNS